MAGRQVLIQHALGALGGQPSAFWGLQSLVSRLGISTTASASWPNVVVPSMGESIKEGTIATVLKQAGQAVKEDEVIAQIETDKVTIDIKAPSAGTLEQLLVKPSDTVVAGQVVAVVGASAASAAPAAAATAQAAAPPAPASPTAASSPHHERVPMIRFPPRVTSAGARISDLPASQYDAAVADATAASSGSTAASAPVSAAASAPAPEPSKAAAPLPPPAAKVARPPTSKNKLPFVTRPDGRGGPPRRPLTARELELINLGGAW